MTFTKNQEKIIIDFFFINASCVFQTEQKLNVYKNVVVRIQFPDSMILQGIFQPTNTIQDVNNFVREHLKTPAKPFLICKLDLNDFHQFYCHD